MVKVIGLMSGTSVDGIDAALVEITGTGLDLQVKFIVGETYAYPEALRAEILRVCGGEALSVEHLAVLDDAIAQQFALAANKIQAQSFPGELIGSHGQTVFHRPPRQEQPSLGYSLQLGRGAVIAHLTGITTVSNFRAADISARGQGAPLVSKIDACLLADEKRDRAIQNIGGISNLTYLPAKQTDNWESKICGWDTGPGNVILDLAVQKLTQGRRTYDHQGDWAAQGTPCQDLIHKWLQQDFFQVSPPKSTGRELFSHSYLEQCWQDSLSYDLSDADWLATITELTAATIVHSYRSFLPKMPQEVLLCGGGHHNLYLQKRLQTLLDPIPVLTTDTMGLNSDFKEAIAFAVLAYWRYHCNIPGNLPQVTGACQAMLLGEINF